MAKRVRRVKPRKALKLRLLTGSVKINEYLDQLLGKRCADCGWRVFPRDLERHKKTGGECEFARSGRKKKG